jgi:hypothetical protein
LQNNDRTGITQVLQWKDDRPGAPMPQTLQDREVDLDQLKQDFGLVHIRDRKLFAEGSIDLPSFTAAEMELLDEVNDEFSYLLFHP